LTLPHTPPKPAATKADNLAWVKAIRLLGIPYILILFIVTFIDATIHNGYFATAGGFLGGRFEARWIMPIMSIGQVAEILTMLILGAVLKKLGWKTTMVLGILGHTARFAVFALFPENKSLLVIVQVLHGICYAFFFATVYIFIDAAFPKDVRTSAQGLFNLLILGLGDLAAKWLFLNVLAGKDYKTIFLVPTALSVVAVVLLALFFKPPKQEEPVVAGSPATAH
jgi:MFS family permease